MWLEILLVFTLTLVNGVLAMSELAIVSSRTARLKVMADNGSRGAATAMRLAADPGRFLSSVQIGITLVGVLSEQLTAIFLPTPGGSDGTGVGQQGQQEQGRGDNRAGPTEDSRYATLEPLYADCDLVIVEGNLRTSAPKIEVWREELGTEPLYTSDAGIEVVVTDSPLTLTPPRFTLLPTAIESLADWVLYRVREKTG